MISPALLSLVGPTIPVGLTFNDCGVAIYRLTFKRETKEYHYEIRLACLNGLWGGSCSAGGKNHGFASPLTRRDFKYTNVHDCIAEQVQHVGRYLHKDNLYIPTLEEFHEKAL